MTFKHFFNAIELMHRFGLKSRSEWHDLCEAGNKPPDISPPRKTYKQYWKGSKIRLQHGQIEEEGVP
jgi:hypothetical protein